MEINCLWFWVAESRGGAAIKKRKGPQRDDSAGSQCSSFDRSVVPRSFPDSATARFVFFFLYFQVRALGKDTPYSSGHLFYLSSACATKTLVPLQSAFGDAESPQRIHTLTPTVGFRQCVWWMVIAPPTHTH